MDTVERRIERLEATVYRLAAELDELKTNAATQRPLPTVSALATEQVFAAARQVIEEGGGEAILSTLEVANQTGMHQTYVSAILRALVRDGKLTASGQRKRRFRLPRLEEQTDA